MDKLLLKVIKKYERKILVKIVNEDNFFTEKIITFGMNLREMIYLIKVKEYGKIDEIKNLRCLPKYEKMSWDLSIPYKSEVEFEIEQLNPDSCYVIEAIIKNISAKYEYKSNSKPIVVNTKIDIEKILNQVKLPYKPKLLSQSEKDSLNFISENPDNLIEKKKLKNYVMNARSFSNIKNFVNSNHKSSKLMTEDRKQRILFSNKITEYFDEKHSLYFNKNKMDPFLKNEWFMGPVYSYDHNYQDYI